jgi:hypothetical protein
MKICDRCFKRDGSATPAEYPLQLSISEIYDLCKSCITEIKQHVENPDGRQGHPKRIKKD